MNWIKFPLFTFGVISTSLALINLNGCDDGSTHGICTDSFICDGNKFSDCSPPKFVCTTVKGCEGY